MSTAIATGAVLVTWLVVTLVLAGVGLATRRGVLALVGLPSSAAFCAADLWTGLAALTGYLLVWSLRAAIGPLTWIAPLVVGAGGLALLLRSGVPRPRLGPMTVPLVVLVVWLANLSLGSDFIYDTALYHFGAIDYASHAAAIPGLGNLHVRLSAGGAHFLFVALLGVRPWSGAGQHLADGLLVSLLLIHIWTIIGRSRPAPHGLMSWRLALLAVPAIVIVLTGEPLLAISSPNIDAPVFVLVIAAGIALAQAFERSFDLRFVVAGIAALATGVATRPQVAPALVAAIGVVFVAARRRSAQQALSIAVGSAFVPWLVVVGLAARQSVLSGYPLFPSGLLADRGDWRVPRDVIASYGAEAAAWARFPGRSPAQVSSWGDWIGHWITSTLANRAVNPALALVLVAAALPFVFRSKRDRAERRDRAGPAAAVLMPSVAALVVWFFVAPDVRFAYGWIWLVAIGLLAWLAPAPNGRGVHALLAAATAVVLGAGVVRACLVNPDGLGVSASGDGPFGSISSSFVPQTRQFVTTSGLGVLVPVFGDQCWHVLWCTPFPDSRLELRGRTLEDGFSVAP